MTNEEKVIDDLKQCLHDADCDKCYYSKYDNLRGESCINALLSDLLIVITEQQERLKVK